MDDEVERKEDPSLPPGYVSLAQLQERWIRKQQEQKLKEKEEAERKEIESRTQNHGKNRRGFKGDAQRKMAGLSLNDAPGRIVEKYDREMGVLEDGGKGKEIGNFDPENAEKQNKKNNRKKKKKSGTDGREGGRKGKEIGNFDPENAEKQKKKKSGTDWREGAEIVGEIEVKVGNKGLLSGEISENHGGLKGIEQIVSVNMVEVLPEVKGMDLRSGFTRNRGNRCSRLNNCSKKEDRVRVHDLENKMENVKGYGQKWIERRRNDGSCYRSKGNNRDGILKSNELEPVAENKAEDGISEVCSEINRVTNKTGEESLNDSSVELEKKVDNGVLDVESVRNLGNVYRRYGSGRGRNGRNFSGSASYGWKSGKVISRFEGGRDAKRRERDLIWVKKEEKSGVDSAEVSSNGIFEDQA